MTSLDMMLAKFILLKDSDGTKYPLISVQSYGNQPRYTNFFLCSTLLSIKFGKPININIPTTVSILRLICKMNFMLYSAEQEKLDCWYRYFNIYNPYKVHVQLN